ncbi:MAG: hypothetical protein IJV65_00410, partial [Kiritimatiellae bacterium]|nr:hypothetical protein [Kiritimatiellia bacterium]
HADAESGLAAGSWRLDTWAENDTSMLSDNLLRAENGGAVHYGQNRRKNGTWGSNASNRGGTTTDMIDGLMNRTDGRYWGTGTNSLVVCTLAEPSALESIRFFAGWGVNSEWSYIAVEGIDVRSGANEPWTELPNSAYQQPTSTTWGSFATFAAGGNDWLARDVKQIRVRFNRSHVRNYDGTMYWEIEAQGAAEADAPALHARAGIGRALSVASAMRTAAAFTGVVSAPAGAPAFTNVVAVWGPAYAGEDTNAWAHARSVGAMSEAASSIPLTLADAELGDALYVRWCGVGADGTVSWSDSVYVPELPILTDVPPVVVFGSCAAGATTASISASVVSVGSLATEQAVDVTLEYSVDPDAFSDGWTGTPDTFAFASGAGVGAIPATAVSPLKPNRRYLARFVATNDGGQTGTSDVFTFDTAGGGSESFAVDWGLLQQVVTGVGAYIPELRAAVWDETQAVAVEGAIMAYTTGSATSTKSGGTYSWRDNTGFIYKGSIYLEGGVEYTFGGSVDDAIEVTVNGTSLFYTEYNAGATFGSYTAPSTGWYPIEVRMSNGGGGAGRAFGLGWNTTGAKSLNASSMSKLEDPGDGSFLRPSAARSLKIAGAAVSGASAVDLSAAASSGAPDGAVWAVWGATDLGTNSVPSAWTGKQQLAAVATGDDATWTATLPIDAAATPVVRVAIVPASGDTMWSAPVLLDAENPTIGPATAVTDGDRMTISGTMLSLGTGTGLALDLLWGYAEDLSDARTNAVAVDAQNAFEATVEVLPGTNGWWRLVARTTDGADATLPAAFETDGGSVLKRLASATVSHHTITASGTLDVYGAGTTTVTVWAGDSAETLAPVAASTKTLSGTGPFTI